MEIRVEERVTGHQMRRNILRRYGSRARLEERVEGGDDPEAAVALVELRLFDEDPRRLDSSIETEAILELEPEDVARLTPERLRLLDHLAKQRKPPNLTQLCQDLGRDKKNVSKDLRILESLCLVSIEKNGRDLAPRIRGNHIAIVVDSVA